MPLSVGHVCFLLLVFCLLLFFLGKEFCSLDLKEREINEEEEEEEGEDVSSSFSGSSLRPVGWAKEVTFFSFGDYVFSPMHRRLLAAGRVRGEEMQQPACFPDVLLLL